MEREREARMEKDNGYQPVACDFHDQLEEAATLRRKVKLTLDHGECTGLIRDIYTTETKEEFLLLDDGAEIRLDRIQAVEAAG
jgi:transcriptional antiterminator Rof (Rho-off)